MIPHSLSCHGLTQIPSLHTGHHAYICSIHRLVVCSLDICKDTKGVAALPSVLTEGILGNLCVCIPSLCSPGVCDCSQKPLKTGLSITSTCHSFSHVLSQNTNKSASIKGAHCPDSQSPVSSNVSSSHCVARTHTSCSQSSTHTPLPCPARAPSQPQISWTDGNKQGGWGHLDPCCPRHCRLIPGRTPAP